LRQFVQSGDLGPLVNVTMKGNEKLSKTRMLAWNARTNPTLFLISHLVDYVTWTTGERFSSVVGASAEQVDPTLPMPPATAYVGRLEGGALVSLASCWTLPEGLPSTGEMAIEVIGASGSTRLDFAARPVEVYLGNARNVGWDFATQREDGILHGWWIDACRYFLQCVIDGTDPEPSLQTALETNFVLEAMTRSLATGRQVLVDDVRTEYAAARVAGS
jgi:predicted dehydrogenase